MNDWIRLKGWNEECGVFGVVALILASIVEKETGHA